MRTEHGCYRMEQPLTKRELFAALKSGTYAHLAGGKMLTKKHVRGATERNAQTLLLDSRFRGDDL